MNPDRSAVLERLAAHLLAVGDGPRPLRVAVDGTTAAATSTLAAELAEAVGQWGGEAVNLSTEGYDTDAFRTMVLDRLASSRRYRALDQPEESVPAGAVVLVGGTSLQAPPLAGGWDVVVWLQSGGGEPDETADVVVVDDGDDHPALRWRA